MILWSDKSSFDWIWSLKLPIKQKGIIGYDIHDVIFNLLKSIIRIEFGIFTCHVQAPKTEIAHFDMEDYVETMQNPLPKSWQLWHTYLMDTSHL